jgi:hypothetical protein
MSIPRGTVGSMGWGDQNVAADSAETRDSTISLPVATWSAR